MKTNGCAALMLGVLFAGSACAAAPPPAPPVSVAGQHVTFGGTIKRYEAAAKSAVFTAGSGQDFVLDLSQAKLTLPGGVKTLQAGQRGYLSGDGNPDGSIAVARLQILPPPIVSAPVPTAPEPLDLTVRGTVESVRNEQGAFVLRVNTHTRIVYVTADTDVSRLTLSSLGGAFPVAPGQRVTVGGALQPDGTLLAGLLTPQVDAVYHTPPGAPNRVLLGTVSSPPDKLRSRDFKVRTADGAETSVRVPRGIPVRRLGRAVSVFDLSRRDSVRLSGRLSGADFRAARIDVLAPPPDDAAASQALTRPGL